MNNFFVSKHILFQYRISENIETVDLRSHCHSTYEILFVTKGKNNFLVENSTYQIADNSLIIIPPGIYHTLQNASQNEYERYIIYFVSDLLPPFLHIGESLHIFASEDIKNIFLKLYKYLQQFNTETFYSLLISALTELLILATHLKNTDVSFSQQPLDPPALIGQTLNFINENLDNPISLDAIAARLFVSKSYLCHVFQRYMKISVMKYIRSKKMMRAHALLQNGMSPTQVAQLLHYDTYLTFLRQYRAEFHCNPSQKEIVSKLIENDFFKE